MPTAPNYGLIGLAQGAGSMPESMASGQNTALALKLRGIQAQEAQRQLSEQQAEDVAGSMPIPPKMQTVPGTPLTPGPPTTPSPQTSSTGEGEPLNAPPQAIPRGEGEPIPPQVQTQAATPETQKEYKFTTPYEQMAYETQQRAERLRSMGMGRTAMKYQQEAMQYGQMHYKTALSGIASSILSGNPERAKQFANSIGMNIQDIKPDPHVPDIFHVTAKDEQGNTSDTLVSKGDFLDSTDPEKAITAYSRIMQTQAANQGKIQIAGINAGARMGAAQIAAEAARYRSDNTLRGSLTRSAAVTSSASIRAGASPKANFLNYITSKVKQDNADLTDTEAMEIAAKSPAYIATQNDETKAADSLRKLAEAEKKLLINPINGKPPEPGTPEREAYNNWNSAVGTASTALKNRLSATPATQSPKPKTKNTQSGEDWLASYGVK